MTSDWTSEDSVDEDMTRLLAPRADCAGLQTVEPAADSGSGTALVKSSAENHGSKAPVVEVREVAVPVREGTGGPPPALWSKRSE